MGGRKKVITRTFTKGDKKITVSTDSIEYMKEQEERYKEK